MARALEDIIRELNSVYDPQRDVYKQQIGTLDPLLASEEQGLQAQKKDEFEQITNRANRRGLFYSGIPVAEEQRYIGSSFLPAVANLKGKYATQRFNLQDAIAKITESQQLKAYDVRQNELNLEEEQRQFNARLAAEEAARRASASAGAGSASPSLGFRSGASTTPANRTQVDPVSAARGAAKQYKAQYLTSGATDPFYRDKVLQSLIATFGDSPAVYDIVYKEVFPDNWAGSAAPANNAGPATTVPGYYQQGNSSPYNRLRFGG